MIPFRGKPNGNQTLAQALDADPIGRDVMIGRVGRCFHIRRMDTAAIARETFLPEAVVCRYLSIYRTRKREEAQWA